MQEKIAGWRKIAQDKQARRNEQIPRGWRIPAEQLNSLGDNVTSFPKESGLLSDTELEITATSCEQLLEQLRTAAISSVEVTRAFCRRAAIAQQLVNCLTEIFFDQAIGTARAADEHLARTGKPIGPLHGLPISIKDSFQIKGMDSTVGFIQWTNQPVISAESETVLVKLLRQAGAVLYCKTNIPASMMHIESYNNVWGRVLNPHNRQLSPGGSTGGGAALVALKGSPLDIGTDIGGSIRIPAAFCGIYGLKPSQGRFPTYGTRSGLAGQEAVASTNGPMTNSLESLATYAASLIAMEPWRFDNRCMPIPWRSITLPPVLCFAILYDDNVVRPFPPIIRALKQVAERLKAAGHEVVEWDAGDLYEEGTKILHKLYEADGGQTIRSHFDASDEPWPKGLARYEELSKDADNDLRVSEYFKLHLARSAFVQRYYAKIEASASLTGTGRPIDCIISPVSAMTACRHDTYKYWGYSGVINLLDFSAVSFPVTKVDKTLDPIDTSYQPRSELDRAVWAEYDPEVYHGAPVGLQLIGKRLEEEKVIEMAKVVQKAARVPF